MRHPNHYSVEIIRYTIPEDQAAHFEKAYETAGTYLQESPYCLGYHLLHGDDEPEHYVVTIYWTSKEEHLNGFRKSSQFSGFFSLVKPYYDHIDEMKHYRETATKWSRS